MNEGAGNNVEQELADRVNNWRIDDENKKKQNEEELRIKTEEIGELMEGLMNEIAYLYTSSNELPLEEERDFSGLYVNGEKWGLVVSEPRYRKLDSNDPNDHRSQVVIQLNKDNDGKAPVNVVFTKEVDGKLNVQMKEGAKPWAKVPGTVGENELGNPKFKPEDLASNKDASAALPYQLTELKAVVKEAQDRVDRFKNVHAKK